VPTSIEDAGSGSSSASGEDEGEGTEGEGSGEEPTETLGEQESRLIDELVQAFADADAAARDGDQVAYARKIQEAADIAERLQELRDTAEAEGSAAPEGGSGGEGDGQSEGGGASEGGTSSTTVPDAPPTTTAGA